MRKWLALVVPMVLLVTGGSRLVAVHEQALALRQAFIASVERDDAQAQAAWKKICDAGRAGQYELSCFWLYLSTEGQLGYVPQSSIAPQLLATYAYGYGYWSEKVQAINRAVFSYQLSLALAPDSQLADRLVGLLIESERLAKAIVTWERIVRALPQEAPEYWWALGQMSELERDWEQASMAYEVGAQLMDAPFRFWMRRGRVCQRLQLWDKAERAYWRALWVKPNYQVPYWSLGSAFFQQQQDVQAGCWFSMALQIKPDDPWSNYYLAQLMHRIGERESAITFLARAIGFHSSQPWSWSIQLGDWYLALGSREDALRAYRQALEWRSGEDLIEERIEQAMESGD
jgi:tetratricopeptide (TPR) repeat protein